VPAEMPALARTGRFLVIAAFAVTILGDVIVISVVSIQAGIGLAMNVRGGTRPRLS
jgi:hypothetical protein